MAEANAAYHRSDKAALEQILSAWNSDERAVTGEDVAHQLVRAIRRVERIRLRIKSIQNEISTLQSSELAQLSKIVEAARLQGVDRLSELASNLDQRIAAARVHLEQLEGQTL
jgi:ABC-type phosphate transport system auxiliary subunit